MDKDDLAEFRDQWKEELTTKPKTSASPELPTSSQQNCEVQNCELANQVSKEEDKPPALPIPCSDHDQHPPNAREECHDIISTCYQQPDSCYYPFSIVGKLLNGKIRLSNSDANVSTSQTEKRKTILKSEKNRFKKFKGADLKHVFSDRHHSHEVIQDERLLDKLIADIDEITEIPFFDMSLPREVAVKIFQFLSITDLCQCAKVSRSWRSLAEDELLWCWLCHRLGRETVYTTRAKTNWKQIVQHNVERKRLLVSNWKNRTGELTQLEYVKGNILCATHSSGDVVVSGYTNGEVKLWQLTSGHSCVFQPSSTALIVGEEWTESNIVQSVATAGKITAACYRQGNTDIWNLEFGTQPIQTHCPASAGQHGAPDMCLSRGGDSVAVKYGPYLDLLHWDLLEEQFMLRATVDNNLPIEHVTFLETESESPTVIYSDRNVVKLCRLSSQPCTSSGFITAEIHNLIDAPINVIDVKTEEKILAVAHGSFMNLQDGCSIKLYDIHSSKLLHTLRGCALRVTCMNMEESPPNELVIGTGDRKVHIFDVRTPEPVQSYSRHSGGVVCVQMDDWKVVSGAWDGFVCVWDRRMNTLLWDMHNRHPVGYSHFSDKHLVVGNIPSSKDPEVDEFESTTHRRYRGSVNCYDFLADLTTKDVPEICLSTYDQPDASKYNIGLAMPYDTLSY